MASVHVRADPNKGPLKLEHDITPRDLHHINTVGLSKSYDLNDSHRFKGFPKSHFSSGRKPVLGPPQTVPDVTFKKAQHFVKGYPLDYKKQLEFEQITAETTTENGHNPETWRPNLMAKGGVQYGLDEHERVTSNLLASPEKKMPFWNEDRTSAEERKKIKQQREAEWDIAQFKRQKEHGLRSSIEEKKRDLQMLREYKPFGRSGGGAPRGEMAPYRTKAVHTEQLDNQGPDMLFPLFGQPGHGAPIRTDSGNVKTSFRVNKDIRFRDGLGMRKQVENMMRYTNPREFGDKMNTELGNMALEKRTQKEKERYMEKEEERMTWDYNPFGKSGAGAPIKTDSGNVVTGRGRTLVKDSYELRDVEHKRLLKRKDDHNQPNGEEYNPWGKGQGAPERDSRGNTKRLRWSDPNTAPEYYIPTSMGVGLETKSYGGGGHLIDERGEKQTRFMQTLKHDHNPGEFIAHEKGASNMSSYEPWGKPGGGAPVMLPDGTVRAANRGKAMMDKMGVAPLKPEERQAKQHYLDTLKAEIEGQKMQRKREAKDVMEPGGETVSWIRSKEVGYLTKDPATGVVLPVHHKGTSDVTRHQMDIRRPGLGPDARDYRTELVQQAKQRADQRDVEKMESRAAVVKHHDTFDQNWGRPGNGAPHTQALRRHSLDVEQFHQQEGSYQLTAPWAAYSS